MSRSIVIFGGAVEGRYIVERLQHTNLQLHICVTTEYAMELLPEGEGIFVHVGCLDVEGMKTLFHEMNPDLCIDATHPYATQVSKNLLEASKHCHINCIRVERETQEVVIDASCVFVSSVLEAARYLSKTQGNIFITTGSKELQEYTMIPDYKERCTARVLSTVAVAEKCKALGFEGKHLIMMQGPFSKEINKAMLRDTNASWLVTKCTGVAGGYLEKCQAAMECGVNLLIVGKPESVWDQSMTMSQCLEYISQQFDIHLKPGEVSLIGMGPGNPKLLTREAIEALETADVIIGAKRVLEVWPGYLRKTYLYSYHKDEIAEYIKRECVGCKVAICYSGDVGFYSGAKGMKELLSGHLVKEITGISSVVYFLNRIGVNWEQVHMDSIHGRQLDVVSLVKEYKQVCLLLGTTKDGANICKQLVQENLGSCKVVVGEQLSYEQEIITNKTARELTDYEHDKLSVIYLSLTD